MSLTEIITTGMNNPDCAFFVGSFYGQVMTMKGIITLMGLLLIFKILDKLVIEPCLEWIKKGGKKRFKKKKK